MEETKRYKTIISEVIARQIDILGPSLALAKARNVSGLVVSDNGVVTDIKGVPEETLKQVVDQYFYLSGQIVKNALGTIFEKHPTVNQLPE